MKLLIFIMALAISHTVLAQPGSYSELNPSEYANDQVIQDLLKFGADEVVKQGIQSGRLPDSKFEVSRTFKVERQVVNGLNYRFDVELTNGQVTIRADYVVYYQPRSGAKDLTSSSFDITSASNGPVFLEAFPAITEDGEGGLLGGWSPVDITELNTDPNLRDILNYGVQEVLVKGTEDGELSSATYHIEDVTSIERQVVSGQNFIFNIVLGDDQGNEVPVSFEVYDQPWTGTRELTDYAFADNAEESGEDLLGSWEPVDVSEVETDPNLRAILDYGVQSVVAQGVESGQLTFSDYQPGTIYSIRTQLVSGTNYRFNVQLVSLQGGFADVIFVVYDVPWENTRVVTSYLFLYIAEAESNEEGNEEYEWVIFEDVAVSDGGSSD